MGDTGQCKTDGCYRETSQVMVYQVWSDGLEYKERYVCPPCANAMEFRETFANGSDAWILKDK